MTREHVSQRLATVSIHKKKFQPPDGPTPIASFPVAPLAKRVFLRGPMKAPSFLAFCTTALAPLFADDSLDAELMRMPARGRVDRGGSVLQGQRHGFIPT